MSAGSEYLLGDETDLAAIRAALPARMGLAADRPRRADRAFYDTFDGRLHAGGLMLVHEAGRLVLYDAAGVEQGASERRRPTTLLAAELPAGVLRERLLAVADVRVLSRIARVRTRLEPARLVNRDDKTVARVVLERPDDGLAGRLTLTPVRGYDKAFARLRRTIEDDLGLAQAPESLRDEAVRAAGGTPGGVSSRVRITLARDQRADAAATVVLAHLASTIEQNLPGTLDGADPEFLHDLRVAVRRTRSVQRELTGVFPPAALARFRTEFAWLQEVTGPLRDLDVQLMELDGWIGADAAAAPELAPVRSLVLERRRAARRRMRTALQSQRAREVLDDWKAFLEELVTMPEDDRPDAAAPIAAVAGARIRATYRRMVKAGSAIDDTSPPAELHAIRKRGKELRYLLELFGSLYEPGVVHPMVRALKALQDTLGRHQDAEVQGHMLDELRDAVATHEGGAQALMAMGRLDAHLADEQRAARGAFAADFAAFAAPKRQARVRRTFR